MQKKCIFKLLSRVNFYPKDTRKLRPLGEGAVTPPAKIIKAALITAVALFAIRSLNFNTRDSLRMRDCYLISYCPDINIADVHPREIEAIKVIAENKARRI